MNNIQITSYQMVSYFLSGVIIILSYFIYDEKITTLHGLAEKLNTLQTGALILSIIISFIIGIVINGFRNGIIEFLIIDFLFIKRLKCFTKAKIRWDFFHDAPAEEISKLEGSYYSAYCSSFNLVIALTISYFVFLQNIHSTRNTIILIAILVILLAYAYRLREQIVTATGQLFPKQGVAAAATVKGAIISQLDSAKQLLVQAGKDLDTIEKSI